MLILVKSPLTCDYHSFLSDCINKLSPDTDRVQLLVQDPIAQSSHLNFVLSTLYTQLRSLLTARGFKAQTQIDVHVNVPSWRLRAWNVAQLCVESSEPVPEELDNARVCKISNTPASISPTMPKGPSFDQYSFDTVAVGGTFDHLHDGHKILLQIASFVTGSRLIVGVTGPELLKNKKYASVLQTLNHRIRVVCEYLENVLSNHQTFIIYQINDVCGPTGYISDIGALVISEETLQGANFVNEYRRKVNMPALAVVAAKVLGGDGNADNNWEGKLSSTDLRKAEYETLISGTT